MKKNKIMRLASILMVAALLTTCAVGGTFAKYTTQDSASDVARVAKWGVELQVVGNLYGDSYKDTIVTDSDASITVQTVDKTADAVAPGTKNENGFTFSLKGQPEVDGEVTTTMKIQNVFLAKNNYGVMIPVDANVVTNANFDEFTQGLYTQNNGTFTKAENYTDGATYYTLEDAVSVTADYYPVVYTLAGNTNYTGTDAVNTLKLAADEIAKSLDLKDVKEDTDTSITYTGTKTFESNTNLATWNVDGLTLTWAWAFSDDNTKKGDDAVEHDKADTILGMLENTTEGTVVKASGETYVAPVEYKDYCLETCFEINMTATQVD